ncbi:unnamed protein product [Dovyalis caffra]|uniref:Transmembrane protein n=1 Tax=Dovyalis caffra TaxID=77055 RepID=A0AAV1REB7_9ROSI|nr:unnamed protein product [Dovyalis caffra]
MSIQQPPPQQQQQPVVLYPNTVTRQTPSSHSNGSFGTVFIVLAVIVVISAIACCLGRICNKRLNKQKANNKTNLQHSQHNPNFRPKERGRERESDVEFGFEKGFSAAGPTNINGSAPRGHKPFGNGHFSGHNTRGDHTNTSVGDHGEPNAGP